MIRSARSELVRLRRLWPLPATAVGLGIVATILQFTNNGVGPRGATTTEPNVASALIAPDGIIAGLGLAANFAGLLTLVAWALSVARDHQTGTIRVLLVSEPHRGTYLAGKLAALAALTTITAAVTITTSVAAACLAAQATDTSTTAWSWTYAVSGLLNLTLATLTWGAIGAALAITTRSAAAAIATGIGYLLLGENLIAMLWSGAQDWLPAGALKAIIDTGTADYSRSLVAVTVYLGTAIALTAALLVHRDITD